MPEEGAVVMVEAITRVELMRWSLFGLMWIFGLLTIVLGMEARKTGPWDRKFAS